jgi:DNA-binding transcriptional MerR regulator
VTVDELARTADVPVRTIREYQTLGLLSPPRKQGRVGAYDDNHLGRLQLIGRLQDRGYSLAGIRDLLNAWTAGRTLPALLGVQLGPIALDETPTVLTAAELAGRVEGLVGSGLDQAREVGLVVEQADGRFAVRSLALLALVGDVVATGRPLADALEVAREIRTRLGGLADVLAERFTTGVWAEAVDAGRTGEVAPMLRRDRLLLIQAAASVLTDELGRALLAASATAPAGERLRAALDEVRVGAMADAAGRVEPSRP